MTNVGENFDEQFRWIVRYRVIRRILLTDEILDVVEDSVNFGCYVCTRDHQVATLESLNFFKKNPIEGYIQSKP